MIQTKYGSYGITVLKKTPTLRVSELYSSQNGTQTVRTLAFVIFPDAIDARVQKEHLLITEKSQSIGSTFKQNGWDVKKRNIYFGTIKVPTSVRKLMGGIADTPLAIHIYELSAERDGQLIPYCTIAEIHHPEYLSLAELHKIYGEQNAGPAAKILKIVQRTLPELTSATHVISRETHYYLQGPQQAMPPQGTFQPGTKVVIIQDMGSYVRVKSEGGIEAVVSSDSIQKIR